MDLLNFINTNADWRTLLANPPYSFQIKEEGSYILIKYNFGITNFAEAKQIGLEARGLIVKDCGNSQYKVVCHGLDKFFNIEEPNAANLNWNCFQVFEKMDGSNIRLWYNCDEGKWHISTLSIIFADNNEYGLLFKKACGNFEDYVKNLDTNCTYVYELVGPLNKIVVRYEKLAAYFICKRNLISNCESLEAPEAICGNIKTIPVYRANSKWEALQLRKKLPENVEGMVAVDCNFNRVKLKTDWYLELHRIRGNGVCTVKRVVKLWQLDALDDFIAAFPEYLEFVKPIIREIRALVEDSEVAFHTLADENLERKVFAAKVQRYKPFIQSCCYALLDNKFENATDFFKGMLVNKLTKYVESRVKVKEFGIEDEV